MDKLKHPNLYKKKPISDIKNRVTTQINSAEIARVNGIVNKFFELFLNKHS